MKKKEEEFIQKLMKMCEEIGWEGTALLDYQTGSIPGVIIGKKEFIDKLVEQIASFESVIRSMEPIENVETKVTEEKKDDGNSGPTFH
jgi:hypothetical protein